MQMEACPLLCVSTVDKVRNRQVENQECMGICLFKRSMGTVVAYQGEVESWRNRRPRGYV